MSEKPAYEVSAREVAALREAREVIQRNDPALALLLGVLCPIPPCPHKVRRDRPSGSHPWRPSWSCAGCGVPMRSGPRNTWRAVASAKPEGGAS
jgi:hypothetical protein